MIRDVLHVLKGCFIFRRYNNSACKDGGHKVWLVLTGENEKVDNYAVIHLGAYIERKIADGAVIISSSQQFLAHMRQLVFPFPVEFRHMEDREIAAIYAYYCFDENVDDVVFTYISGSRDNLLWKLLQETTVNEEEIVCLGLYRLRRIPERKAVAEGSV